MARSKVVAEEFDMDVFEQACIALNLTDDQCSIMREAAETICTEKGRKKREPSQYQKFISQCMKAKKIKKFGEASSAMKECAREWRVEKERRGLT